MLNINSQSLTEEQICAAADSLVRAEDSAEQIVQLSQTYPEIQIDDAYAIQNRVRELRLASGVKLIGHKVGLTSKAMQESSQIDEPDYGCLFDTMMLADGGTVQHSRFCVPRVEMELAFHLKETLRGPNVTLLDALDATDYVVPSIEIIDARVQNPRRIFDTVADNGAAAALILGGKPVRPGDVDLRWIGGLMYRNAQIWETGVAAGVLGHPAQAIAWLANKLSTFDEALHAGEIVLSGSFTRPVWADPGDTIYADFGPLGTVSVSFA